MYILSDTHACHPLGGPGERTHRYTLCVPDSMQPYHTKCRHEMPSPTSASSESHQDFTLGISYHCANFRILACTSDHNCWSSTGNRVKITLLQSKDIKDRKKSHISLHHKERMSLPIPLGLESHVLCFLGLFSQPNRNYCLLVKKIMGSHN